MSTNLTNQKKQVVNSCFFSDTHKTNLRQFRVCKHHFTPDCWLQDYHDRQRLKPEAFPTLKLTADESANQNVDASSIPAVIENAESASSSTDGCANQNVESASSSHDESSPPVPSLEDILKNPDATMKDAIRIAYSMWQKKFDSLNQKKKKNVSEEVLRCK